MKLHYFLPALIIILLAFLLADFVYQQYEKSLEPPPNIYFLQQGVYLDKNSIKKIDANYITIKEDQKYYTYLGMTTEKENALKIKELYEKRNIPIYIKEKTIENEEFLSSLSQYDILLENTNQLDEIENILETILSTYEESLQTEGY